MTVAAVTLLALTQTIVMPVIAACIVAAVTSPVVAWLQRHRVPRGIGAAIVLLSFVVLAVLVVLMVTGGILSQTDELRSHLNSAQDPLAGWLQDAGVSTSEVESARGTASDSVGDASPALLDGVVNGIGALSSLVVFLSLTALSLFFLLKDGPSLRRWVERHAGVPRPSRAPSPAAAAVAARLLRRRHRCRGVQRGSGGPRRPDLRRAPAGTIAIVTFIGAYIPYLGAWTAASSPCWSRSAAGAPTRRSP